jgi:hypothetical protein
MPLSLKIPALSEKPLLTAETRSQKLFEFLEKLPIANPKQAASMLLDEMEILNRQKVAPDARVRALEIYRPSLIRVAEMLATHYSAATLPLPAQAKEYAAAAESLWLELGYGYKLALVDQQGKLFTLGGNKANALILQRAIESLGKLAMVYYQTYVTPPGSLWQDLHQLYMHAVQESLLEVEIEKDNHLKTTVNLTYKQVLLMSLADPQHLPANDIQLVADYIERHAQYTDLQGLGVLENPAGVFIVRLDSEKPPIPYIKNAKETDPKNDILLITVNLARLIHKHLKLLQSGEVPSKHGLPENAADPRYLDMLTYLIKHWGIAPKRVFSRSRKNDAVELAAGVATAHYFINGQKPYQEPESFSNVTEITSHAAAGANKNKQFKASRWQALNISAGGMALRKFPVSDASIRVGEILGVKSTTDDVWSLAILRWASNDDQQLEVGTQLIAPSAEAIAIKLPKHDAFEPALLLPEIPALKQPASIVANCGSYGPARVLELHQDNKILKVLLTKLIDRTGSFERFHFSYL